VARPYPAVRLLVLSQSRIPRQEALCSPMKCLNRLHPRLQPGLATPQGAADPQPARGGATRRGDGHRSPCCNAPCISALLHPPPPALPAPATAIVSSAKRLPSRKSATLRGLFPLKLTSASDSKTGREGSRDQYEGIPESAYGNRRPGVVILTPPTGGRRISPSPDPSPALWRSQGDGGARSCRKLYREEHRWKESR